MPTSVFIRIQELKGLLEDLSEIDFDRFSKPGYTVKVLNFVRPENGLIHDPLYNIGFEKYENEVRDCYLFMADYFRDLESGRYNDKEKLVFAVEEPNFCWGRNSGPAKTTLLADHIFTLCPYTAQSTEKRTSVFYPFNEDFIPKKFDKEYDVIYSGSNPRYVPWTSFLRIMSKYKYRHIYYNSGTNPNCSYQDKINLLSKTKITLVHGLCSVDPSQISQYMSFPNAENNKAFSHLNQGLMPQTKTRMFEPAFCKSLILCYKDPWNVIENFFTPNKDFIYFENESDLSNKLDQIINDYENYQDVINSAYEKAINNYTTKHFVERYLK
jgi:hypothetical protein